LVIYDWYQLIAGVVVTEDKFVSSVVDTAEQFIAGVVDTADKNLFELCEFSKKV
jgi:hypothetical protein